MSNIILTKGLPASGKTTWATGWKNISPLTREVVCRDDIREEFSISRSNFNKKIEKRVLDTSLSRVEMFINAGKEVCVADTNLNPDTFQRYVNLANKLQVRISTQDFTQVPLIECLQRDAKRKLGKVGETPIISMWERYLKEEHNIVRHYYNKHKPYCIVSDIDGTIADNKHRDIYDFSKVKSDTPIEWTRNILCTQYHSTKDAIPIIYVSGREDTCKQDTTEWLVENYFPLSNRNNLLMRKQGDSRSDWLVKEDIAREILTTYNILWWLDDRWSVTVHLRSLGINVLSVAFGRF